LAFCSLLVVLAVLALLSLSVCELIAWLVEDGAVSGCCTTDATLQAIGHHVVRKWTVQFFKGNFVLCGRVWVRPLACLT